MVRLDTDDATTAADDASAVRAWGVSGPSCIPSDRGTARGSWLVRLITNRGVLSFVDQGVVSATNFLTTLLIGRWGGQHVLGAWSLGFSIVVLALIALDSLICVPYTVHGNGLSGPARSRLAGSAVIQFLILNVIVSLGLCIGAVALSHGLGPPISAELFALSGVIPLVFLRELGRRYSFAHLEMARAVSIDIAVGVLQLSAVVGLAWFDRLTPVNVFLTLGAACGLVAIVWLSLCWHRIQVNAKQLLPDFRQSWQMGRWVFAAQSTGALRMYVPIWTLAMIYGTDLTGIYAACCTIVMLANPIVLGTSHYLIPKAAALNSQVGPEATAHLVRKACLLLGTVLAILCLVAFAIGGEAISWLYGAAYAGHQSTISVLALATLANGLCVATCDGLWAMDRSRITFVANAAALVVVVIVSYALAPLWNVFGVALGLLAGTTVLLFIQGFAFVAATRTSMKSTAHA